MEKRRGISRAPRVPQDRRRRGVAPEKRVEPDLNATPIPFPEPLKHANELLAVTERAHDVVMKERAANHRDASTQLVDCARNDEHRTRNVLMAPALGDWPLHR